jgi:uncharacterized DUF497 family protein
MPSWDHDKRLRNLRVHGLDFADAEVMWDGFTITREDIREDYGEGRWFAFGMLGDVVVVLVYTERNDEYRYISLRRATANEQTYYFEAAYGRRL